MYNQSHLKRILPRREDQQHYRTEFPSHYYSNSSVYSYSPTSSSGCAEHGTSSSHRTTKIILTLSVTFATLGVLTIAGVAVYLGFLSKHVQNADLVEESYLYSTAVNPKGSVVVDPELFQMPNGRSRTDFYADDPIDLTNRLEEEPVLSTLSPHEHYLTNKHATQILFAQRNVSKPFFNAFPSLVRNPGPTAIPAEVIVSSEKVNGTITFPPPTDLQSPLIILGPKRTKATTQPTTTQRPNKQTSTQQLNLATRPSVVAHEIWVSSEEGSTSDGGTDMVHHDSPLSFIFPPHPLPNLLRPSPVASTTEGFHPVNPNYGVSQPISGVPLEEPKMHLTFDRISPDFYDKKPWTPLLIPPTQVLDKRPRVDGVQQTLPVGPVSGDIYYNYGDTGNKVPTAPNNINETVKDQYAIEGTTDVQHFPPITVSEREFEVVDQPPHPDDVEASGQWSSPVSPPESKLVTEPVLGVGDNKESKVGKLENYDEVEEYDVEKDADQKVYTLDPMNTDMVDGPAETGSLPIPMPVPDELETDTESPPLEQNVTTVEVEVDTATNASTTEDSVKMKSTTDFILSSLGNLNLVKTKPIEHRIDTQTPLFPPTRSYVSVHLPLREKPPATADAQESIEDEKIFLVTDTNKKLRLVNGDGRPLAPDLTSSSTLNKVLSMMMTFEDTNPEGVMNLLKNNVHLVVSHNTTGTGEDSGPTAPVVSPMISKTREHKSFLRDPKIDSRFRSDEDTEQVPVPLMLPTSHVIIPPKLSSMTLNQHNSPVYKFVLRKGQSVEDLLKEIFRNYTDKGISMNVTTDTIPGIISTQPQILDPDPVPIGIELATKFHALKPKLPSESTKEPVATTFSTTSSLATTEPTFKTSTSIVINAAVGQLQDKRPNPNATFTCLSSGLELSSFARCNFIKECTDNSDEKSCQCRDYLKSQFLHRKICDGIVDCADESDESYCDWCSPGQYICVGSRVCVPRDKICDSRRDCPRGDDESNCVKIGPGDKVDDLEDISPIYHQSGYLMVRKKGVWGKLCVETFSSVLAHWEIKDLARAVCKAKTFSDFESVEKVYDDESKDEPYYELYNSLNDTDSSEKLYGSDESTPRSVIGFKLSQCSTRVVVKVKCGELQCGTAPRAFTQAARIVGGSNALPGGWPWQAALYRDGEYQCGATLISGRWLLSAGHCFYHAQDDYWVARLGTLRRGATFLSPYEQVIKITHIFLHPQYKDIGFVNDVSLLRLEKEVNFTDFVRPVCLPEKDTEIKDGRICTVVGWGQLFETGRVFPDTLQEVQLPLISTAECRKRTLFLPLYKLTDEMFCAGFDRGGRDACLGDSGGPLMCPESDGRWSLYGVTSNGYGCARANRPGVYTKTKSYLDWVYDKISQDSTFTYRDKTKRCLGHRCLLGECLESRSVCNGIADCVDGSDERNCNWS